LIHIIFSIILLTYPKQTRPNVVLELDSSWVFNMKLLWRELKTALSTFGILFLDKVRSERTSQKEMISDSSWAKSCLSLLIQQVAAPSSYSSLANCLLQMSCSQNSPISPYIKYLARIYIYIGIDIVLCWFTLFSLSIILLSYPKLTHPNIALDLIMMIVSHEITMEMKNWPFYLKYHLPWWSSLRANFPKKNDTWFFKSNFFHLSWFTFLLHHPTLISQIVSSKFLVLKTHQFFINTISHKEKCSYCYLSLLIHIILSTIPLFYPKLTYFNYQSGPTHDKCFIWIPLRE
jgi:hypothetical protein